MTCSLGTIDFDTLVRTSAMPVSFVPDLMSIVAEELVSRKDWSTLKAVALCSHDYSDIAQHRLWKETTVTPHRLPDLLAMVQCRASRVPQHTKTIHVLQGIVDIPMVLSILRQFPALEHLKLSANINPPESANIAIPNDMSHQTYTLGDAVDHKSLSRISLSGQDITNIKGAIAAFSLLQLRPRWAEVNMSNMKYDGHHPFMAFTPAIPFSADKLSIDFAALPACPRLCAPLGCTSLALIETAPYVFPICSDVIRWCATTVTSLTFQFSIRPPWFSPPEEGYKDDSDCTCK